MHNGIFGFLFISNIETCWSRPGSVFILWIFLGGLAGGAGGVTLIMSTLTKSSSLTSTKPTLQNAFRYEKT